MLTPKELSERSGIRTAYLSNWRVRRNTGEEIGPKFVKVGRHVRYLLTDIEAWERTTAARDKEFPASTAPRLDWHLSRIVPQKMTIDERLDRLKERHDALRRDVESLTADIEKLATTSQGVTVDINKLAAAAEAQRISIVSFAESVLQKGENRE